MESAFSDDCHTFTELNNMKVSELRELQYETIEQWNRHLKLKDMVKNLRLSIDDESVNIYVDNDNEPIHVVYWHLDEVKDDESVSLVMAKAVQLFYTNPIKLLQL